MCIGTGTAGMFQYILSVDEESVEAWRASYQYLLVVTECPGSDRQ